MIYSAESTIIGSKWLKEHGPRELEQLFRSIVYYPSAPILIADNDGRYQDASVGAAKLLGLRRDKVIGQNLKEFAESSSKSQISQLWQAFLAQGEQAAGSAHHTRGRSVRARSEHAARHDSDELAAKDREVRRHGLRDAVRADPRVGALAI